MKARAFRFRYPDGPEDTEAIAVLPNGDVTIVSKGRTPTISFFGFAKADIVKALVSHEVLRPPIRATRASRQIRDSADG